MKRKIMSLLLALVLVISLIPISALPASAADTQITGIYATMRDSDLPETGKEVLPLAPNFITADQDQYTAIYETGYWRDSAGTVIAETDTGTGYRFQNGVYYSVDVTYTAAYGYTFGDGSDIGIIKLNNEFGLYTYSYIGGTVIKVLSDGSQVTVRYTFQLAGNPSTVINKVTLNGNGKIIADSFCSVGLGYHTCKLTDKKWKGTFNNNQFILGNSYDLTVVLTANSGYTFEIAPEVKLVVAQTGYTYHPEAISHNQNRTVLTVEFRIKVTDQVQFPAGVGESVDNPAICTNFAEFKYAMEHSSIRYVALQEFQENLPKVEGADQAAAVSVKNDKQLYLQGNTVLSEAVVPGYHNYGSLLQLPAGSSLTVRGPGTLKFNAYGSESKNAVIHNMGGTVRILGGTLNGSFTTRAQGVAIWQDSGELIVKDGNLCGENSMPGTAGNHYAVYVNGGSATITGGTFKTENKDEGQGSRYGLGIGSGADVTLEGGTFRGIHLPTSSTPLSDYVDEDVYTVLSDGSWINPTSQYSQEYTASGKEVRVLRRVKKVTASVTSPIAGANIEDTGAWFLTEGYTLAEDYPRWYKDGQRVTSGTFEAGAVYEVVLRLMADTENNFEFAPDVVATVNGNTADIATVGTNLKSHCISVTYRFPACPQLLKQVDLTIDAPKQNGTPDQYVTCVSSAYKQALAGENMFDAPLQWQESSDGNTWTKMKATDTFTVGRHYRVYVDIKPASGYEFALDPQLEPAVVATVNGFYGAVYRYPEADPSKLISVCFTFGILNDTVIEQIDIDGVVEPVVDEKPDYGCAISGTGYTVNTAYSNGTYIIGGIGWYDVTDDKWMRPNDTFQIGHQYKVFVDVKTYDGYEFYTTGSSHRPAGWGYINGNYATLGVQMDAHKEQSLSWTFTCQPKTVQAVDVTMHTPKSGQPFDFAPKTASEYYTVSEITWVDEDGNDLTAADRAQQGSTYRVYMTVEPAEEEGKDLCKFVNDKTTATINGAPVVKKGSWDEVVSGPKKVQIFYTFQCGADWLKGDFDSDGDKDTDDAVYLLLNIMFGDGDYPVPAGADKDVDRSGSVSTDDAVYLLLNVMFGAADYPM